MDQIKAKFAAAAKHWFWISTALVTLLSVGAWWLGSGRLMSEFEAARTKLDGEVQKVSSVRSALPTHPNAKSHELMEALVEQRTDAVMEAWTNVYERQREILKWPVAELKEDFVSAFEPLFPIELKVEFPTAEEDEIETSLRNRYRNYIGNTLPKIAEIAKTKWTADFHKAANTMGGMDGYGSGSGGYGSGSGSDMLPSGGLESYPGGMPGMGPGGVPREEGPLVTWDNASQERLLADLFPWRGGDPTTLDVLYSQENLWILRQLMQIIATVNGDAGQRFQAKIRGIQRLSIGRSVPKAAGTISRPKSSAAAGGMFGSDMGYGMMESDMSYDMMGSGSGGSEMDYMGSGMGFDGQMEAVDPGDGRYVDPQGVPVESSAMRAALSSNSPSDAFMAVAKRVPVMMTLKMDQNALPELLSACGSAPLMVEVKHVRVLPASGAGAMTGSGGGGMGMGMGSGMPGGSDMSGSGSGYEGAGGDSMYGDMSGGMPGGSGGMSGGNRAEAFPMDLVIEVYGIIHIYNPPSAEALGIEQVDENTVVDGTVMGTGESVATTPDTTPEPAAAAAPALDNGAPIDPNGGDASAADPAAIDPAVNDPAVNGAAADTTADAAAAGGAGDAGAAAPANAQPDPNGPAN